jgi:tRNA A37 threonylcarbamoyladenosine synthetase subunit TsaC/SUA5/YrdC
LTIIFPGPSALEEEQTVALRMPADSFLQKLLFELDCPLYSTSVNLSGGEALWKIGDIIAAFAREVGLIIDAGDLPGQRSSTILDICQKPYKIIRQGALQLPDHLLST